MPVLKEDGVDFVIGEEPPKKLISVLRALYAGQTVPMSFGKVRLAHSKDGSVVPVMLTDSKVVLGVEDLLSLRELVKEANAIPPAELFNLSLDRTLQKTKTNANSRAGERAETFSSI